MDTNIQLKSDEELALLSLQDQAYFIWLIRRYESKLIRYVRRISSFNSDDIEDVVQEVFIKIYKNLNAFDPQLKFSSWIYRITHNEVISHYRKMKARPQNIALDFENGTLESLADNLDMEKEVDSEIVRIQINNILDKIDIKYREVLILKYLEQKDYQEMSDILRKPIGTIGTLINRAKKLAQEELKKQNIKL